MFKHVKYVGPYGSNEVIYTDLITIYFFESIEDLCEAVNTYSQSTWFPKTIYHLTENVTVESGILALTLFLKTLLFWRWLWELKILIFISISCFFRYRLFLNSPTTLFSFFLSFFLSFGISSFEFFRQSKKSNEKLKRFLSVAYLADIIRVSLLVIFNLRFPLIGHI